MFAEQAFLSHPRLTDRPSDAARLDPPVQCGASDHDRRIANGNRRCVASREVPVSGRRVRAHRHNPAATAIFSLKQATSGTCAGSGTSLDDHARRTSLTVVSCQHGAVEAPEEGGRECAARGRRCRMDRGSDAIRSPLGRHAMRGGWRYLRMPGVHLVHASKPRQSCQAIEALHRTVPSSGRLTERSAVTCPFFTSP